MHVMKKIFTTLLVFIISIQSFPQKIIEMIQIGGVYQIPCKVNGIPMNFIFDTGATDVTISITEANFLLKQGLLTKDDFIGNSSYILANGDIVEGSQIYIKSIDIDGKILQNVKASVINKNNSPLLLGQSAIKKLGKYSIHDNLLIIENEEKKGEIIENTSKKNIKEAVNYISEYLSLKTWGPIIDNKLEYNDYSRTLTYKSYTKMNNSSNTTIEIDFTFGIDDVINIKEVIFNNDEDKILIYRIFLKNKIYKTTLEKSDNNSIPIIKSELIDSVVINPLKKLTISDIQNIGIAVRDIFQNIEIETEYIKN